MNVANVKIVLGNQPLSDDKFGIYLRITKNRKKKEIGIGLRCEKEHFINEQLTKNHPNYRIENELILNLKSKALKIIREFQLQEQDFSLQDFEAIFRGNNNQELNIIQFFDEIINEMERAGRMGNARAYKETRDALVKFSGNKIIFNEITPVFLEKFEVEMRERGNKDGGIAFKMRELRAIFNKAINRKIITQDIYPFKDYKISKLKTKKNKKALSIEDFKKIRDVDLSEYPYLIEAHNYFLFSFYTRGMNFVDMMKLKWSDIQDGRIYYTRSKTKGQFSIEITEKVEKILNYYKVNNTENLYVFPILLKDNLTPKQIANRKHKVLARYNSKLKQIAKIAGIEKHLTTYVARHSFATILKQIGTSTDVISELMGHSDVQITMTYLKEFDNDVLDKENRKLLEL
ncbi:site-specific integrase [Apibacter adventoris]|uniref:Integrase n=1 Tax=Apibacter adventoris TaxID=1679466 RepID=A0A2S8A858_9FLAO|nr:site-specific integrase [Apibacter adventoris]PQL90743.1 integrase [Apibacter adventoris]